MDTPETQSKPQGILFCPNAQPVENVSTYYTSYSPTSITGTQYNNKSNGGFQIYGTNRRLSKILSKSLFVIPTRIHLPWSGSTWAAGAANVAHPNYTKPSSAYFENNGPTYNHNYNDNFLFIEGNVESLPFWTEFSALLNSDNFWRIQK